MLAWYRSYIPSVAAADPVSENMLDCMHVQLHMGTTLVAGVYKCLSSVERSVAYQVRNMFDRY